MDMPICQHFCSRVDHGQDNQVTAFRIHLLPRSQRPVQDHCICQRLGRRRRRRHRHRRHLATDTCVVCANQSCRQGLLFPCRVGCAKGHRPQTMLTQDVLQTYKIDRCVVCSDAIQINQGWILIEKVRSFSQLCQQGLFQDFQVGSSQLKSDQRQVCALDFINSCGRRRMGHGTKRRMPNLNSPFPSPRSDQSLNLSLSYLEFSISN